MHFERTHDLDQVRRILTHPTQYRWATDDAAPAPEQFRPNGDDRIWYVLALDPDATLGILSFLPQNAICWEVHCALLPVAWGRSHQALRGAIEWVFEQGECRRVVASIPAYNRLAVALAITAGMSSYGRNERSFLKDGRMHDQLLFGISAKRPEETSCPVL